LKKFNWRCDVYLLVVYDSKTGNVKRFVHKLDLEHLQIADDLIVNVPFVLVTYTTGSGEIPLTTSKFLEENSDYLRGVAVSGNRNWGNNFAIVADIISSKYSVPILLKFELSGTQKDIQTFKERLENIETHRT
jgi:protein involved in ribonucleotide reduction